MKEYFNGWLGVLIALGLLLLFKQIRQLFREVYGRVDKVEFGGFLFFGVFLWMLWVKVFVPGKENVFSDTLIIFVGMVAITGLGLTAVFRHMKDLKNLAETPFKDGSKTEELP